MDQLINVVGFISGYFAVMLGLAIVVETILDFIKLTGILRARISPEQAMKDIKEWLPEDSQVRVKFASMTNLLQEYKVKAEDINKKAKAIGDLAKDTINSLGLVRFENQMAALIADARKAFEKNESRRIGILRFISALIGVYLAWQLQIDSFELLSPLFPENIRNFIHSPEYGFSNLRFGGIIISGFAASAGSSFWHDQLDKVRAVKESARVTKESFSEK